MRVGTNRKAATNVKTAIAGRWLRIRKRLGAGLAAGIVLCLAGCGGSGTKQAETQASGTKTQQPAAEETSGQAAEGESYELVFAHIADENNSWHKAALKFKEIAEAGSNGRIQVSIYPNNSLGSESEVLEMIQTGTCDITITADSLSTWAPDIGFMGTPYMIADYDHLEKVVNSEVGETIEKEIREKAGMRCLTWLARGPRYLTSTKRVTTPADLSDVVIRVPDVPMYVKTWEGFGAKPVPMALSEVFTSVQQGTINAQENPLALIKSNGFAEVFPYCMETEHVRGWIYVVIGENKYQSLPDDLKQVVDKAAAEMQTYEREIFYQDEKQLRADLEAAGMEFVPVEKEQFEALTEDVVSLLTDSQRELYDKAVALK